MYKYDSTGSTFTLVGNLTDILNNLSFSATNWKFSNDCQRILVKNYLLIYIKSIASSVTILSKPWISADETLTYALDSIGIWKFDPQANNFIQYYVSQFNDLDNSTIIIASDPALILYSRTCIYTLAISGNNLIPVFNMSISNTILNPNFSFSASLRNLVIYGPSSTNTYIYTILGFCIDYSKLTYQNITIPTSYITDITKTKILIEDDWIYIRQLNSSIYQNGNLEIIYGLQ
jgi:hypothetical protein